MDLLSLKFWKNIWKWCKVNWKFLVGFAIPCIALYFLNQKKARNVLKAGLEFRKKQLGVDQRAANLEKAGIKRNAEEFAARVEEVTTRHDDALQRLADNDQSRREKLGGSDPTLVTEELANKFNLENGDNK